MVWEVTWVPPKHHKGLTEAGSPRVTGMHVRHTPPIPCPPFSLSLCCVHARASFTMAVGCRGIAKGSTNFGLVPLWWGSDFPIEIRVFWHTFWGTLIGGNICIWCILLVGVPILVAKWKSKWSIYGPLYFFTYFLGDLLVGFLFLF